MREIERAAARNLLDYVEAVERIRPDFGAAAIECAGGIAAFLGPGSPLTAVKGAGPELSDADIAAVERFFQSRSAERCVFELAPWISPETTDRLLERGYELSGTEDVVSLDAPFHVATLSHTVEVVPAAEWPDVMHAMNDIPDGPVWRAIVEAAAVLPGVVRLGVREGGNWIACAEIQPVGDIAILGNDATLEAARGRGVQTALIQDRLLRASALGLRRAAAEVAPGSTSERNYLRCGFEVKYRRTHYVRVLE